MLAAVGARSSEHPQPKSSAAPSGRDSDVVARATAGGDQDRGQEENGTHTATHPHARAHARGGGEGMQEHPRIPRRAARHLHASPVACAPCARRACLATPRGAGGRPRPLARSALLRHKLPPAGPARLSGHVGVRPHHHRATSARASHDDLCYVLMRCTTATRTTHQVEWQVKSLLRQGIASILPSSRLNIVVDRVEKPWSAQRFFLLFSKKNLLCVCVALALLVADEATGGQRGGLFVQAQPLRTDKGKLPHSVHVHVNLHLRFIILYY